MNEEFLRLIYDNKGFSEKGSFEEFSADMQKPELQKLVYDNHFKDKGSFEEFRANLGSAEQPQVEEPTFRVADQEPAKQAPKEVSTQAAPEQPDQEVPEIEANIPEEGRENAIDIDLANIPIGTMGNLNLGFLKNTFLGDFTEDVFRAAGRGFETGAGVGESLTVLAKGANASGEDLTNLVDQVNAQQKFGVSDEFREFQEAEGFKESLKAFARNPVTIITEAVVESSMAMARSGGIAIAGAAATGPAAVVLTPLALGSTSAALETSGKMVEGMQEFLTEKGLEFNEENIEQVFADEEAWEEIRNKAIGKGAVVGLVDGATAGLVSKMGGSGLVAKLGKASKAGRKVSPRAAQLGTVVRQAIVESGAGGVGELASQAAIGEDLDFKSAVLEVIGEIPGAASSITSSAIINQKRLGKLTDDAMAKAVQDNSREDFNTAVDVSQQLGQIDETQAQELKSSFEELAEINDTIPSEVDNKQARKDITKKIRERREVDAEIEAVRNENVDESFQNEKDETIADLEDQRDEIVKDIEGLKSSQTKSPQGSVEQVSQTTPIDPFQPIEDTDLLNQEIDFNITNAKTGKVESIKIKALDAQNNIMTELDRLDALKKCL
jgi:hypothetical protein